MDLASFTEKKDSCDFTKVAENVWKLVVRFPFGMREVNCYLFKGEKGYTIVDTGDCHETAKETWNKVLASVFPIEKNCADTFASRPSRACEMAERKIQRACFHVRFKLSGHAGNKGPFCRFT